MNCFFCNISLEQVAVNHLKCPPCKAVYYRLISAIEFFAHVNEREYCITYLDTSEQIPRSPLFILSIKEKDTGHWIEIVKFSNSKFSITPQNFKDKLPTLLTFS